MRIKGEEILNNVFNLYNVPSWGLFGALMGYVFFFRFQQYFNFAKETEKLPFLSAYLSARRKKALATPTPISPSASVSASSADNNHHDSTPAAHVKHADANSAANSARAIVPATGDAAVQDEEGHV